ncbi:hypothetical protein C8Q80DRAFT_1110257 [Daedaleopsis nitida]|nr:hypothetical protein C8Q80DRAFT_1110257 [Daedaleopsis nitida]
MLSRFTSSSALAVHLPPIIYTNGSTVEGEVEIDFRALQEENIDEVQARFRCVSEAAIGGPKAMDAQDAKLVRLTGEDTSLWSRGGAYPQPGSHTLRCPFKFTLPPEVPPSFHYASRSYGANVRYSVTAVGVRKGRRINKRHQVTFAVLPLDKVGARIKAAGETHGWKKFNREERIRKGLFGEYSKVEVELALADIPVLPIFSTIPYSISVTTTSPPLSRSKANALPADKPVFPPVPASPHDMEFKLNRRLKLTASGTIHEPTMDVASFLGGKEGERASAPIEADVPGRLWVPLASATEDTYKETESEKGQVGERGSEAADPNAMGMWVQRATYRSTFRLTCAPSFAVENIRCSYKLVVKVPFPGVGNDLKLEVPVTVTSGIVRTLAPEQPEQSDPSRDALPPNLDLPPAYWEAVDADYEIDEKN